MAYKLTLLRFVRYRARKNKGEKTHSNYRIRRHEALSQKHQKKNKKSPPPKKNRYSVRGFDHLPTLLYCTRCFFCICIFSLLPYWYIITYLLYCTDLVSNPLTEYPLFFFLVTICSFTYSTVHPISFRICIFSLLPYWYIIYSCLLSYSLTMY